MARKAGIVETKPRAQGGGRKPRATWRERYESDPHGASPVTLDLPHSLAAQLEATAAAEGTTVNRLLLRYAHERMFDKQVL